MNEKLVAFFQAHIEPNKSCFYALREVLLKAGLSETIKYGMPCYTFKNKVLCYLWSDKKSKAPYILFVDGLLLDHASLEKGNRAKMKILPIDPNTDLPLEMINEVIALAKKLK